MSVFRAGRRVSERGSVCSDVEYKVRIRARSASRKVLLSEPVTTTAHPSARQGRPCVSLGFGAALALSAQVRMTSFWNETAFGPGLGPFKSWDLRTFNKMSKFLVTRALS